MHDYLGEFLNNAQVLVEQQTQLAAATEPSGTPTILEFSLLIIHCREVRKGSNSVVMSRGVKGDSSIVKMEQ